MATAPFYWVFRYGGRDVLAAPAASVRVRRAAVQVIPAATARSKAFKTILEGVVSARAERFAARRHFNPVPRFVGFDWSAFDDRLGVLLGRDLFETAVVQPPQGERNRFYVHVFSRNGERFAFAKVSADERNDIQLRAEVVALSNLSRLGIDTFKYPRLLAAEAFRSRQFLLLESLPALSSPAPEKWTPAIERVRREIAGEPRRLPGIEECSWWPEFATRVQSFGRLSEEVIRDGRTEMMVCRAHGDFVNWNFYREDGTHWLFDWEAYTQDAPPLVDELRFLLGLYTRKANSNPSAVARLLHEHFGCQAADRRREVLRALAFLHGKMVTTATVVAGAWPEAFGLR